MTESTTGTSSTPRLAYLLADRARAEPGLLDELVRSESLWDRRIAILTTFAWIAEGEFDETLRLAELLIDDPEDLMHKAVGWMLREVGNRDEQALREFLDRNAGRLPRTALRYSLERLPDADRKAYMAVPREKRGG